MKTTAYLTIALLLAPAFVLVAPAAELEPLLKTLRAAGPKGAGSREAAAAWQKLIRCDAAKLPQILAALDGAGPLAANWIGSAADAIAQAQLGRGGKLPAAELQRFVGDVRHAPRARRLAYELLTRADPSASERLLPGMLDDPSLELRRDAVARLIDQTAGLEEAKQADGYTKALFAARDFDQIKLLADRLRKLGRTVDLPRHFGFIVRWKLIGPFDNAGEQGYAKAYPPEKKTDFAAACDGKKGPVKWIDHISKDDYGRVDFNKVFGEQKDVVAYAAADFIAKQQEEVEFRITSFSAVKLWVNGRLVDEHNVYHGGSQMDQYVSRAALKPGRNSILVKVCQNAQTQSWARRWGFQLRVCDHLGTAILSIDRNP